MLSCTAEGPGKRNRSGGGPLSGPSSNDPIEGSGPEGQVGEVLGIVKHFSRKKVERCFWFAPVRHSVQNQQINVEPGTQVIHKELMEGERPEINYGI